MVQRGRTACETHSDVRVVLGEIVLIGESGIGIDGGGGSLLPIDVAALGAYIAINGLSGLQVGEGKALLSKYRNGTCNEVARRGGVGEFGGADIDFPRGACALLVPREAEAIGGEGFAGKVNDGPADG